MVASVTRFLVGHRASLPIVTDGLSSGCAVCGQEERVQICSGCRVVSYCGQEHQLAHRPTHRYACFGVKKAREELEAAEALVQLGRGESLLPTMPNTNPNVGKLFTIYLQSPLVLYLRRINTVKSVETQRSHLLRCHELLPTELAARCFDFRIAALEAQARLGHDKELEDTRRSLWISIHHAVNNKTVLPINYLIGSTDSVYCHGIFDLSILMIFIKIKLLLDLMRVDVTRKILAPKFPERILDIILLNIPQSPLVTANPRIMNSKDLTSDITKLATDLDILIAEARPTNPYFWVKLALHNPSDGLLDWPSKQEALDPMQTRGHEILLWHAFYWFETPGAIPLLRQKLGLRIDLEGAHIFLPLH